LLPCLHFLIDYHKAFFYDWLDRNATKKGKTLPEKIGSMQYFLHGYQGKYDSASFANLG
jgi:hypothetical protein